MIQKHEEKMLNENLNNIKTTPTNPYYNARGCQYEINRGSGPVKKKIEIITNYFKNVLAPTSMKDQYINYQPKEQNGYKTEKCQHR